MKIVNLDPQRTEPIAQFNSIAASKLLLAEGRGQSYLYHLHFDGQSRIDRHVANFHQIFLVISGSGWVSGDDGKRVSIKAGQFAVFTKGETHSKGSETGMDVIMFQCCEDNGIDGTRTQ